MQEIVSSVGRVKWFNEVQGFGIIMDSRSGTEVYVHYTAISEPGYRSLRQGQLVEFQAFEGANGLQAAIVRKIE